MAVVRARTDATGKGPALPAPKSAAKTQSGLSFQITRYMTGDVVSACGVAARIVCKHAAH